MSKQDFYLVVGADCEATQHAIRDPALGERAVRGLAQITAKENLKMTYFVIPTDLEASPAVYRELAAAGHEVSLHLHPADLGYEEFLGIYGPDDQHKILAEAADRFAQVMGYRSKGLCIGYASGNDYTYPVVAELGFRHGMLSIPTRILPECASVWAGAPLGMHYVNPYNRILPGWLDVVNIPCTLDPESRLWGGKHPQDLRVELVDAKNHWYTTAKAVDRQLTENTAVKYISACTHNIFHYDDPNNFRRQTLEKMIRHVRDIVGKKGGQIVGVTQQQLAAIFRKTVPIEQAKNIHLKLDTQGRN
ncbi:MAG: polysaccharide deacetylase family protein [Phycisphaerae bacterium]